MTTLKFPVQGCSAQKDESWIPETPTAGLRADIETRLSPGEIRNLYAHQYPEVATAKITGREVVGDKLVYRFSRAIGSKG